MSVQRIESALLGKVINYVPIKNLFENEVLSKVSKIIEVTKIYKFIEQYKFDDDINKVSINTRGILKYYFNLDVTIRFINQLLKN